MKVIDGSTVSMPDTVKNQSAYPQPKTQKAGCGFPLAKIGVIFSLATGAAIALVIDVLNTHDIKLARQLYQFLNPLDILLGDRAFCSYAEIIAIKKLDCDVVFRKHQARKTSMHKGKIVGDCDKLVSWCKPIACPKGLNKDEFDALPQTLTVREIFYYIVIPGFRTERVSLITTLLDIETYPSLEIVELYGNRREVEVNLKHLKTNARNGCFTLQNSSNGTQGNLCLFTGLQSAVWLDVVGRHYLRYSAVTPIIARHSSSFK